MIKKLLIANRDEIAVRILNTCRKMGIATVAVYSEADKDAMHVKLADEEVCIGPDSILDSYMNMENLIEAARLTGCDALHPGYGFLSENARFAHLVRQYGLLFIGPDTNVIQRMGNKLYAKETLSRLGIPTLPGSTEVLKSVRETREIADVIGYPVIVKAVSGGGGKGLRVAYDKEQLEIAYFEAKSDVGANFGDDAIYLERLLENTKHIEVQILADQHQNIVHLGERDCSIQRNHRKLIEEAPCGMLTQEIRRKIIDDALKIAKHVGYDNVGTIEFLLDADLKHYFIEMNPRIQVEHTVSEMLTGIDIVQHQIRSACGLPLMIKQEDIALSGHAIECRINAEDPSRDFLPSPGKIDEVVFPTSIDVRIDTALTDGTFPADRRVLKR
jgi:acetyl-CoA carboxylase biotin carboxylase subunit